MVQQYVRVQWVLHPERDADLIEHRKRLLAEQPGLYSKWLREAAREKLRREGGNQTLQVTDVADAFRSVLREEIPGMLAQWSPGQITPDLKQPAEDAETTEILDSLFTSFDEGNDQ